jgi:hypothetical protein
VSSLKLLDKALDVGGDDVFGGLPLLRLFGGFLDGGMMANILILDTNRTRNEGKSLGSERDRATAERRAFLSL